MGQAFSNNKIRPIAWQGYPQKQKVSRSNISPQTIEQTGFAFLVGCSIHCSVPLTGRRRRNIQRSPHDGAQARQDGKLLLYPCLVVRIEFVPLSSPFRLKSTTV
jgi:hypothetical protein